jgi:hypothetical protein
MLVRIRVAFILAAMAAASGCTCAPKLRAIGDPIVVIDTPAAGTTAGNGSSITFHATAYDAVGISTLMLGSGGGDAGTPFTMLQNCKAPNEAWGIPTNKATCEFTLAVDSYTHLITQGEIILTAVATDRQSIQGYASVIVNVKALTCRFVEPGTDSAVANVGSISNVSVAVMNQTAAMKSVVVTSDNGTKELNWSSTGWADAGSAAGEFFYSNQVKTWASEVGVGMHKLTATCTDVSGNVDSDTMEVNVGCGSDSDCPSGDRCCSQDGKCYATVAEGADCDCQHPCPSNEGCFPGICDAAPQKCRPGCFPGADTPPPYGTAPASCAAQDGLLSFCNNLPADQVTSQNMGGACAVGDNCDPIRQNCPDLPLDRSKPATMPKCTTLSASCPNPTVPQNCVPFAPGVNGCVPAGPIASGGTGCNQTCGQETGNCAKGTWCTQAVDQSGNPLGPPTCSAQCPTPTQNPANSAGCPAGEYCDAVFGLGMVFFSSGVCQSATGG